MSTAQRRGATWSNPDGLVVGFGPHLTVREGSVQKNYGGAGAVKSASVSFNYKDAVTNDAVNVPVPAGSHILMVSLVVGTAWVGGTNITVGDGSSATGFIDGTQGATANLTAGAKLTATGAYTKGGTDTTAQELKLYSSADTIDVRTSGTFTAGDATLVVTYI
jgi:hypothetical protein